MTVVIDTSEITKQIGRTIRRDAIGQQTFKRKLGRLGIKMMTERTRKGYGFRSRSQISLSPLKPLSGSYIAYRDRARDAKLPKRLNTKLTTPSKSNLTFTGRMLQSLKVFLLPDGVRIEPTGKRADTKADNKDVTRFNEERCRFYLQFSENETERIVAMIDEALDGALSNV